MARSDGTFPIYKRLDVHPSDVPVGYWTSGTRRCIKCETEWPNYLMFEPTPCCGTNTVSYPEKPPTRTWREACRDLLNYRFEQTYSEWNEGQEDADLQAEEEIRQLDRVEDEFPVPEESSVEL